MRQYGPRRTAKTERRRLSRLGFPIIAVPDDEVDDGSTQGTMFDRGLRPRVIYPKRRVVKEASPFLTIEAERGASDTWFICHNAQRACDALVGEYTPRRDVWKGVPPDRHERIRATQARIARREGQPVPVQGFRPMRRVWYQETAKESRLRGAILPLQYTQYRKDWRLRCYTVPSCVTDALIASLRNLGHTVVETTTNRSFEYVKKSDR